MSGAATANGCKMATAYWLYSSMSLPSPKFDTTKLKTIYPSNQPEFYETAENALFDGDGTFTYQDQLWQVCDGKPGEYLDVWPALA